MNKPPCKIVADVSPVREVTLLGKVDLGYWRDRLDAEELSPTAVDGHAQALVICADMRFKGIRFQEISFSVLAHPRGGDPAPPGAYLLQAYNSCRFFAFVERTFFGTPYHHGTVAVSCEDVTAARLTRRGTVLLEASRGPREPAATREDGWAGPVYLPTRPGKSDRRAFWAHVQGATAHYPFDSTRDAVTLRASEDVPVIDALLASGFAGQAWQIRAAGHHQKSETCPRSIFASGGQVPTSPTP